MRDFLLEVSKRDSARRLVKSLGLPIPIPTVLERARGPRGARQLSGRRIAMWSQDDSAALGPIAAAVDAAGGRLFGGGAGGLEGASGVRVEPIESAEQARFDGLLLDATEVDGPQALDALYAFFHPLMRRLAPCGRVVVVGRPVEGAESAGAAAAAAALEGFVRSLAKEVGKQGATAQLIVVEEGAEASLAGPLRFVLSERSAYVTGQVIRVSMKAGQVPDHDLASRLAGKVALVTGAARGIGAATARILADEGAQVVCLDLPDDERSLSRAAERVGGVALPVDITTKGAPEAIAGALSEEYGGVDIVVHNAGVTRDKTLKNMKGSWWDLAIEVNLRAVVEITEKLVDDRVLNDFGRIICLSSIAGLAGNRGQTNYAASKAGIVGLVGHLSERLGDCRTTVNAVAPGFIETRMTEKMPAAVREVARRLNSLGQGGKPEDVGQAIAFLATPGAQGVTGQVLRVCGGSMVGR